MRSAKGTFLLTLYQSLALLTALSEAHVCDMSSIACPNAEVTTTSNTPLGLEDFECSIRCGGSGGTPTSLSNRGDYKMIPAMEALAPSAARLFRPARNVALHRPVYASPHYQSPHYNSIKETAVDGSIIHKKHFYHSQHDKPLMWFLVDLEQPRDILEIRIAPRQDGDLLERFQGIAIYAGNSLITSGDFSSYDLVGRIPGPATHVEERFSIFLEGASKEYQYVAVQKHSSAGRHVLELAELEVFAIVDV